MELIADAANRQQLFCGFRKLVLKPEDDMGSLWAKAKAQGLTYQRAAVLLEKEWLGKWGISTVRDAVQGRGKVARENQLRVTLKKFLESANSATGQAASASPGKAGEFHDNTVSYKTRPPPREDPLAGMEDEDLLANAEKLLAEFKTAVGESRYKKSLSLAAFFNTLTLRETEKWEKKKP